MVLGKERDDEMKEICDRCGQEQQYRIGNRFKKQRLFPHKFTDCMGEEVKMNLCWDCDWDVMNGGDPFEDAWEIDQQRREQAYAYDPINNPPPY